MTKQTSITRYIKPIMIAVVAATVLWHFIDRALNINETPTQEAEASAALPLQIDLQQPEQRRPILKIEVA